MRKQILTELYNCIDAIAPQLEAIDALPIVTQDIYRGQPGNPEKFEGIILPAIWWELSILWEDDGTQQHGTVSITAHIELDLAPTASIMTSRDEGLKRYEILALIQDALDNMPSTIMSKLRRVDEQPVDLDVNVYETISYEADVYRYKKKNKYTATTGVDAKLTLNAALKEHL